MPSADFYGQWNICTNIWNIWPNSFSRYFLDLFRYNGNTSTYFMLELYSM